MLIFTENQRLHFRGECSKDGFELGKVYAWVFKNKCPGVSFPNGGPDMLIDFKMLNTVCKLLGCQADHSKCVDRIKDLLNETS